MGNLRAVLAELLSLFVDDGNLALLTVLLVAAVALTVIIQPQLAAPLWPILPVGCLAILAYSVLRSQRR